MRPSASPPDDQPVIEDLENPGVPDVVSEPPGAAASFVRTAFGHGALYILGGALSQAMGLLLFPLFAQVLSPHAYGIIDLAALAATLAGVTVGLEVSQGLSRYFLETTDPGERRTLASTALIFTVTTFSIAAAAALVLEGPLSGFLFGRGVSTAVMATAIIGVWCSGILYLTQFLLQIQLRPRAFGVVTVVTTLVGATTSAILVLGFRVGVAGAFVGQIVGAVAGTAVAFGLSRPLYSFRFDFTSLKRMLSYSVPLIPGSVGVFLNAYADRIAIRTRLGVAEVGVYGAGYRLALIVSLLLLGLQGAVSPLVLSRHAEEGTRRELARLFRLFCAVALAVLLLLSLFAIEALHVLTPPAYYAGASVVPFVVAASFLGGMYVFAPGMNIVKKTMRIGVVVGLTGAVNLILAFALVGPLGIRGPALAFLVACAVGFGILMVFSQRVYRVPYDWRRLLPRAIAVGGLLAIASALLDETVSVEYVLIKLGLAAAGLAVIAGLVDRGEYVELVRLLRELGPMLRRARQRALRRHHATPV
jgi:O-antigen/teichoic acid export membrane protein